MENNMRKIFFLNHCSVFILF